jgi:uncharacterized protein (AIM24 family)
MQESKDQHGIAAGQQDQLQLVGQSMEAAPMLNAYVRDRPAFAHVEVFLNAGQTVMADSKAMIWMDQMHIETKCDGCGAACARSCAGEGCCQNFYTGPPGGGRVTFGLDLPGDMLPFGVTQNDGWVVAASSYTCGTPNIEISSRFAGCYACCCGGTNAFLTKIRTKGAEPGMFFAGGYGAITRHEIPEGRTLYLDTGLFFAANEKTQIEGGFPGGCISCCYGGEGLVMKFRGPAVVYSQNRDSYIWHKVLHPAPPKKKKAKGVGGIPGAVMGL